MAVVDHDYSFVYVNVGACGRCSDAGVWRDCNFTKVNLKNVYLFLSKYVNFM